MRILIIDDSKFSQITTAKMLRTIVPEIEIDFAGDGEEGWQKYRECKPDFVFVDLLMPEIDGQTLIQMIKEQVPEANIIVISADVQHSVRQELEEYGIRGFFNKPFSMEKAQVIANLLKDDV